MEYGKLFSRSASIVWRNKFLIVLGFLAAIGSGLTGGGSGGGSGDSTSTSTFTNPEFMTEFGDEIAAFAIGAVIAMICVGLVIGLLLWVISTIARGGLIAGVDTIESGEKSGFRQAWGAAWHKVGTLLGISLLPAIPALILFVLGLLSLGAYGGFFALFGEEFAESAGLAGMGLFMGILACIIVPIMLVLLILRNFAERAAMLENLGVLDSYRRGTSVLTANIGQAIILIVLQIAIFVFLGLFLFVPFLVSILCCCLWPLLFLLYGYVEGFVSALWTLAWREWTGVAPLVEKEPAAV